MPGLVRARPRPRLRPMVDGRGGGGRASRARARTGRGDPDARGARASSPSSSAASTRPAGSFSGGASERQARLDAGELPDFLPETREVREGDWRVAPVPDDLQDRRVEITGPVERKMMINALNSGARCFMADFEDANSPTWANCVDGQVNLVDAIERTIELETRGQDLPPERRGGDADRAPARAGTCPSGTCWSTASPSRLRSSTSGSTSSTTRTGSSERGAGPYFYLPKLESHLEARLWNDVFDFAEDELERPARLDQGDGAHRDDPRRLRDGGDPLRAARPLGGPQRRPLGLHLQHHQEVPRPPRVRAPGPGRR